MASGQINGLSGNGNGLSSLYVWTKWESAGDIAANASEIVLKIYLRHSTLYNRSQPVTAVVSGQTLTANAVSISYSGSALTDTLLCTITFDAIPHNTDGTKSVDIDITYDIKVTYAGSSIPYLTCYAKSVALDSIPRSSDFTADATYAGSNMAVTIDRAVATFTHKVRVALGDEAVEVTGAGTSASVAIPDEWIDLITTDVKAAATVTVTTYDAAGVEIGTRQKQVNILVPENIVPTLSPEVILVNGYKELYIQGVSRVRIAANASGVRGSTINTNNITYSGAGYTGKGATFTSGVLNVSGYAPFVVSVTDSRGRSAKYTVDTVTVIAYQPPRITAYSAQRAKEDGTLAVDGEWIKVYILAEIASVNDLNSATFSAAYAESGGSYGNSKSISNGAYATLWGTLDLATEYTVRLTVRDSISAGVDVYVDIPTNAFMAVFNTDRSSFGMHPPGPGGWFAYDLNVLGALYTQSLQINDAPTLTVGRTARIFDGSENLTWTIDDIGTLEKKRWSSPTKVGSWTKLCTLAGSDCYGILLAVRLGQAAQQAFNVYYIGISHSKASITQIGGSGYTLNAGVQLRTVSTEYTSHIEFLNTYGYNSATSVNAVCTAIFLHGAGTFTAYTTYAAGNAEDGTVTAQLTSLAAVGTSRKNIIFSGSTTEAISFDPSQYDFILVTGHPGGASTLSTTVAYGNSGKWQIGADAEYYAFNLTESGISALVAGTGTITQVVGVKIT